MLKHKAFISRSSAYKGGVCIGPEGEANGWRPLPLESFQESINFCIYNDILISIQNYAAVYNYMSIPLSRKAGELGRLRDRNNPFNALH